MISSSQDKKNICEKFNKGLDDILAFLFNLMILPLFTKGSNPDFMPEFSFLRLIGGLTVICGLGYGGYWLCQHISIGFVS